MGAKVTFNSELRLITVTTAPVAGVVTLDVQVDLYSDMKEDMRASDVLAANPPAFLPSEGGAPTATGATGDTYFLNNPDGWRLQPYDADHECILIGNMFAVDATIPWWVARASRTIVISREFSNLASAVPGALSSSELQQLIDTYNAAVAAETAADEAKIAAEAVPDEVWAKVLP